MFSLGCAPAGTVLYGSGRAHIVAGLEGAKLAGIALLGYILASGQGVYGMAWTMAAVRSTIGVATVLAAHRCIERMPEARSMATNGDGRGEAEA